MHTPSLRCYLEATAIFHSRAMSEVRVPTISDKPPCKSSSPPFLHKRALPQSKSRFISVTDVRPPRQTCSIKSASDIPRSARSELRLLTKRRPYVACLISSHPITFLTCTENLCPLCTRLFPSPQFLAWQSSFSCMTYTYTGHDNFSSHISHLT